MSLELYNSRTKQVQPLLPLHDQHVRIYSCGPTVYDHVHIGNLSAFIVADVVRRVVRANDLKVTHVMNFTDVDDKTIRRSRQDYPDMEPLQALETLTGHFSDLFLTDLRAVGADIEAMTFIKATAPETIDGMRQLVIELYKKGYAYVAEDGVYFSIDAYKKSGKTYGQLVEITTDSTSSERIQNDEYDKESAHDFSLWKTRKPGEPAWELTIDGNDLTGRPGWHLECSVMSRQGLGQPFDIHTGGIDLAFPHHENEIAQSTACEDDPLYANVFLHNEHILVDGKKMSKSLGNFYTLADLARHNIDGVTFRLLVLQSHYRKQTNFSIDNAHAAAQRLRSWRRVAALRHQIHHTIEVSSGAVPSFAAIHVLTELLNHDLDTPRALAHIDEVMNQILDAPLAHLQRRAIVDFIEHIDATLGFTLLADTPDITEEQKQLILERRRAREAKDWAKSDVLRDELLGQGIVLRDTAHTTIWERN